MQFEKVEKKGSRLVLRIKGATVAQANAMRRAVVSSLSSFAIDEVDVYENNSPLFNEYIANRLGLVPLTWEEGVADDAKISLTVDAEGPRTVYSKDLQSTDEKIAPFLQNIPIISLSEGQRFRAEAIAAKGTARQHAKYQCALASYSYYPNFAVNKNCNNCKECVDACPKRVISKDIKLENADKCDLCGACEAACPKGAIKVKPKEGEFSFAVESYNNVGPQEHLEKALSILHAKAEELKKEL
ncbi:MAG: DNA-directed RNA polymerase subunit D [Candidatus Micrarchaeia archaeon]|jgi:DNA-directed RNA polymerase subunit D